MTEKRIVKLRITCDEERVRQCNALTSEGFERWKLDQGKTVEVLLPPVKVNDIGGCELPLRWQIATQGTLMDRPNGDTVGMLCEHFLDMD